MPLQCDHGPFPIEMQSPDSKLTYRFRSCSNHGTVIVEGDCIQTTVRHGFSRFTFSTPISAVHPYPIRSWSTPSDIWFLFAFSLFVLCGVLYDQLSDPPEMPLALAIAISLACLGIFAYAWSRRREEWVCFSTAIDGHWIRFCRGGRDRHHFDDFTDMLTARVAKSSTSDTG